MSEIEDAVAEYRLLLDLCVKYNQSMPDEVRQVVRRIVAADMRAAVRAVESRR